MKLADGGRAGADARLHAALRPAGRAAVVVATVREPPGSHCPPPCCCRWWSRFLLGSLVFRRRVHGAYFRDPQPGTGRRAGDLPDRAVGHHRRHQRTDRLQGFFGTTWTTRSISGWCISSSLAACSPLLALARQLMRSRYGELLVAVRDGEERVRFLGHDPANVKLVAYVVAAGMAGLAGALFVPAVGIINLGPDRASCRRSGSWSVCRGRGAGRCWSARSSVCDRGGLGPDQPVGGVPGGVDLPARAVVCGGRSPFLPGGLASAAGAGPGGRAATEGRRSSRDRAGESVGCGSASTGSWPSTGST